MRDFLACPSVVGLGGTLRVGSSSERALRQVLEVAAAAGAQTELITVRELELPMYDMTPGCRSSTRRPGS